MNKTQPQGNPLTQEAHRREVFWQITVPFAVSLMIILGLSVWTVVSAVEGENVSLWADISLIFLILPTMFLALIPLIALGALAFGLIRFNIILPPYAHRAQKAFVRLGKLVRKGSDRVAEPIIRLRSAWAGVQVLRRKRPRRRKG
jgi:hypothetical protein